MKRMIKLSAWLIGGLFALSMFTGEAKAALSDNVDIHVSINGTKSVTVVGTTFYDFGAMNVNTSSVAASSFTIQNDSTVFVETYTVTGANATSSTGGTDWTISASTGSDNYVLQAQFGDARPSDLNSSWTNDTLTASAITCSDQILGNGTLAESGTQVAAGDNRALWFRLKTPSAVSDATEHNITVTVTVL